MKKKLTTILSLTVMVAVGFALTTNSLAFDFRKNKKQKPKATGSFVISGNFSGTVASGMEVGKREVWLSRDTIVYVVGQGRKAQGLSVSRTPVDITCKYEKGIPVAKQVILRPATSSSLVASSFGKEAKNRIVSESNSNVGELTREAAEYT